MEKRIQIPAALYNLMVEYIQDHYDPKDSVRFNAISAGIKEKREAEIRRNVYSAYKQQTDPEMREMLRQSYLDKAGIPSHGRWSEKVEEMYREGNFDF